MPETPREVRRGGDVNVVQCALFSKSLQCLQKEGTTQLGTSKYRNPSKHITFKY